MEKLKEAKIFFSDDRQHSRQLENVVRLFSLEMKPRKERSEFFEAYECFREAAMNSDAVH